MPTNIAELQAKFTADVGQLQASVESAFSNVEKTVSRTVAQIKKSFDSLNYFGSKGSLEAANLNKLQAGFESLSQSGRKQLALLSEATKSSNVDIAKSTEVVAEAAESSSRSFKVSSSKLKKDLNDVAQGAKVVAAVIGGELGTSVLTLSAVVSSGRGIAAAFASMLSPIGLAVAGVTALAGAAGYLVYSMANSKEELSKFQQEALKTADATDRVKASLENLSKGTRSAFDAFDQAEIKSRLLGDSSGAVDEKIAALKATIVTLTTELNKFANEPLDQTINRIKELAAQPEVVGEEAISGFGKAQTAVENYTAKIVGALRTLKSLESGKQFIGPPAPSGGAISGPKIRGPQDVENVGPPATQEQLASIQANQRAVEEYEASLDRLQSTFQVTQSTILDSLSSTVSTFIDGIAGAIATAAIYGTSFADIMTSVFAAASQELIKLALKSFIELIGIAISLIVVDNYRAYASIPFIGLALGAAGAAATIAAARSTASSKGGHAFAEGGIVTGPMLGLVGEAGNEAIIPLDRLNEFIADRPGSKSPDIYLDGFLMTSIIARILPKYLKHKGVA